MPELHELLDGKRNDDRSVEVGDTVRVHVRVVEGGKERVQVFEGLVISQHRPKQIDGTFTVRRVTHQIGVERTFMFGSPRVDRIEVMRHGRVRRAKLYYLRGLTGKAARIRERRVARPTAAETAAARAPVAAAPAPASVAPAPETATPAAE